MQFTTGLIAALLSLAIAEQVRLAPSASDLSETKSVEAESDDSLEAIKDALKRADIIDDVVDEFTPQCFLAPFYGRKHRFVNLGNKLKPSKTQYRPSIKIYCPHLPSTPGLTVILTDPDAPSRDNPKWSEMCHWISVIPIPEDGMQGEAGALELSVGRKEGKDLVEYKPPGPPPKTGFHRYVFLLLQGDNSNITAPSERQHWGFGKKDHGVMDWAKEQGLEVIGANFFLAKHKKQK